jgi:hypothetical protein
MELQSLCCNFDLEDKLNLSLLTPQKDTPLAFCVIDPRPTPHYQPPRSTSIQAQICRFMQEALHAQFHFLKLSNQVLNDFSLSKCLKIAEQQLEFFLQKHQWQAHLHAVIFIPSGNKFETLKIVCIGNPTLFSPSHYPLEDEDSNQAKPPKRGFGGSYPFTVDINEIDFNKTERYVIGFLSWQPLIGSRTQDLIHARWKDLPEIIIDMINSQEVLAEPFFIVQISIKRSGWIENLKLLWQSSLHMIRKLIGIT